MNASQAAAPHPAGAAEVERSIELCRRIEAEVGRVIVGQQDVVRHVLICLIAGGHALLEGVPGLGKTLLVRTLGQALELGFQRVQFTPDLMPADIVGTEVLAEDDSGRRAFRFRPGPVFCNLLLADEINRATPKTQSALLEAMAERTVTVGDQTRPLPRPFFVLATQNPIEQEGTYPLPEAQLDRFLFKVLVPFPTEDELLQIVTRTTGAESAAARPVAGGAAIVEVGEVARQLLLADSVARAAVRVVTLTHPTEADAPESVRRFVRQGASPRGVQALILGARVRALLEGRYNVAFEDIAALAPAALRHRLVLNFEAQAEGVSADRIVAEALERARASFAAVAARGR